MAPKQLDPITEWEAAVATLAAAKKNEMDLRKGLVALHFPGLLDEGTHHVEDLTAGNEAGIKLSVTQPYSYKVDDSLPDEYKNAAVFRIKVELNKREYNKLNASGKKSIQRWLTITPGSPSLKSKHA